MMLSRSNGINSTYLISWGVKWWLANPQVPPILWEMHSLYDHTYIPNNADVDMMDDDWKLQTHGLAGLSVPKDLQPLLHNKDIEIHLYAQLKCDGIIHSTYVTHEGNSQIFFYLDGNRKLAPLQDYNIFIPRVPSWMPYLLWNVLSLWTNLSLILHQVHALSCTTLQFILEQALCHCGWWYYSSEHMVILSLNKVSSYSFLYYTFYMINSQGLS